MSQQLKYVNLNPFPIYLPCSRGGQVMFRSGEGSTQQWFSRFCGLKQLTKMGVSSAGKQVPVAVSQVKPLISIPSVVPPPLKNVKMDLDSISKKKPEPSTFPKEETDTYVCENGVYRCKLCDRFMTGSHSSLQAHITTFHNQEIPVAKPQLAITSTEEGETVVVSSRKSATQHIPKEEGEPDLSSALDTKAAKSVVTEEQPPESVNNFPCTHVGCGKAFTTERGLKMHMTRAHK